MVSRYAWYYEHMAKTHACFDQRDSHCQQLRRDRIPLSWSKIFQRNDELKQQTVRLLIDIHKTFLISCLQSSCFFAVFSSTIYSSCLSYKWFVIIAISCQFSIFYTSIIVEMYARSLLVRYWYQDKWQELLPKIMLHGTCYCFHFIFTFITVQFNLVDFAFI